MASLYEQQLQQQQHAMMPTSMNDHTMYPISTPMNYATANEVYHTTCNNQQFMENNTYASGPIMMNSSNNQHQNQQQQHMIDGCGGVSLSEASVCSSSMGVRTPDIHPVPDVALSTVTQAATYGDMVYNTQQNYELTYAVHDPVVVWPTTIDSNVLSSSNHLSRSSSIRSEMIGQSSSSDEYAMESSSPTMLDNIHSQMEATTASNNHYEKQEIMQQQNEEEIASMRTSSSNRRNTVSLPMWCDNNKTAAVAANTGEMTKMEDQSTNNKTEKEIRRQSMNDLVSSNFCHLSREQLIERVVQLEKEKQLNSNKLLLESSHTITDVVTASAAAGLSDSHTNSDEDEIHSCLWVGCNSLSMNSLEEMITHIRDVHIGSGKAAYYCEWAGCPREQKPFLKRHKMQNHMRTHTGERPFECTVEGCDKKFSRPDSLNTHIKTHSSIRPYACPVEKCGKAYFHSRSLRKHAKSHESANSTTEVTMDKAHPYDRSLKQLKYNYHQQQQQQQCGTELLRQVHNTTITTPTTNTFFISPTPPPIIIQQQQEQQQQEQQQQIYAAGPAYVPYHHYPQQQQQQQQQYYYAQLPYYVSNNNNNSHPSSSYANAFNEQQYIY